MFSVVIPAYNSEKTLRRAVESVIHQSRYDLIDEIIIVDDGSVDNTRNVVSRITDDYPQNKIIYIFQENAGPSSARNKGIKVANSEWIALLDADDLWLPNKIARQHEIISSNDNILFLGSQYPLRVLFRKRQGLVKLSAYDLCIRSMPYTPTVVFDRKTAIEFGLFNEEYRYNEDADFFLKFLLLDSYYVLAEQLVEIDIGKDYYGASGLSSNIKEMYSGKKRNMRWLYDQSLIRFPFLVLMNALCDIKLFRRTIIQIAYRVLKGNKRSAKIDGIS